MSAQASIVFTFTLEILIIFASSIILLNTIVIAEETRNTTINNINNNNYLPKLFNQVQQSVVQISSSDDEDIAQ